MIPTDCQHVLNELEQEHVLKFWDELSENQKNQLSAQIQTLDLDSLKIQKKLLENTNAKSPAYSPVEKANKSESLESIKQGQELIAEGKVGCLIIAGGMGTRLHIEGPKGTFPVTLSKKSLYQVFSERISSASKMYNQSLPAAIMTSQLNDQETKNFFQKNKNFGLSPNQIDFFTQKDLPILNRNGDLFLENKWRISVGPNGNGDCLKEFYQSEIWAKWKKQGIEYVNVILIDNPLADPFDAKLIGMHDTLKCDILVKTLRRRDPNEKVGVIARIKDKIHVIEYSEIDLNDKENIDKFPFANLSLFSVTMDFIEKIKDVQLPLHKSLKAISYLNPDGKTLKPTEPNAWKFETFIFDVFAHGHTELIAYSRDECFAPLKNKTGANSPETVLAALQNFDKKVYEKISGIKAPDRPFELDTQFYYPAKELLTKWKGKSLPETTYIFP